jgi:cytochrome P450
MKWYNHFGEAFLIVAPDGTFMHICNAEGHNYMTSRREQFPKWVEIYNMLQIFGQNVVSAEGFEWRHHRKLMAGSFNEQNAGLVFKESVRQAQGMLSQWAGTSRAAEVRLTRLPKDTMKLALHVIGYVGFGLRLLWPGQTMPQGSDSKAAKFGSLNAPKGFTMPFIEAVTLVLENIFFVLCLPTWLLRK